MAINNGSQVNNEEYPLWMTQAQRGIDWGALIAIGFCLLAAWSYIVQADYSTISDNEAYVFRIADQVAAFEDGLLYTRWSPHTLGGYGAPVPQYYPSGAVYSGALLSFLFSTDTLTSMRILYVVSLIVGGSMVYTFVAQRSTSLAGIVAMAVYVFNPYMMVTLGHINGDLPLAMGVGLLPAFVWSVNRLLMRYQSVDFVLIAVFTALTIFTVPILLLQSIIASLVLIAIEFRQTINWTKLLVMLGAIGTGILLSAFYWVPAVASNRLIEWHASQVSAPIVPITLWGLLQPIQPTSTQSDILYPSYNLGWGLLAALLITVVFCVITNRRTWLAGSYFVLSLCLLVFVIGFMPEQSDWLLLIYFCFAIAISIIGDFEKTPTHIQSFLVWAVMVLLALTTLPIWHVAEPYYNIEFTTGAAQVDHELAGHGFAVLPKGSPLPSHLSPNTIYENPLTNVYDATINRLSSIRLNAPLVSESPYGGVYAINTNSAVDVTYLRAYHPLWRATTDTAALNVYETSDHQLGIAIPAGTFSDLNIRLRPTITVILAWSITISAIVICIGIGSYRWQQQDISYDESLLLNLGNSRALALLLIGLLIARGIATQYPQHELWSASPPEPTLAETILLDDLFELVDYQVSPFGNQFKVTSFWRTRRSTNQNYLLQLRITDTISNEITVVMPFDHIGAFPTSRWDADTLMAHQVLIDLSTLDQDTPYALTYDILICNVPCDTRLTATDDWSYQITLPQRLITQ